MFYVGAGLTMLLGCEAKPGTVTLDVVVFSYLSRPIFDVSVGGTDVGVAGPWPYSGRGSMSGVLLRLGRQPVKWRLGDTGEVVASSAPELKEVPSDATFLGLHIYEDQSVDLVLSQHFPELSQRGQLYDAQWREKNAK